MIVFRSDKGRGVVISNKSGYTIEMKTILSDSSKIKKIGRTDDVYTISLKLYYKINILLLKLKNANVLSFYQNNTINSTCSGPEMLHGLQKIH